MTMENQEDKVVKLPKAKQPSRTMKKNIEQLLEFHKEKHFTKMIVVALKEDGDLFYSIRGFYGRLDGYIIDGMIEHFKSGYPLEGGE